MAGQSSCVVHLQASGLVPTQPLPAAPWPATAPAAAPPPDAARRAARGCRRRPPAPAGRLGCRPAGAPATSGPRPCGGTPWRAAGAVARSRRRGPAPPAPPAPLQRLAARHRVGLRVQVKRRQAPHLAAWVVLRLAGAKRWRQAAAGSGGGGAHPASARPGCGCTAWARAGHAPPAPLYTARALPPAGPPGRLQGGRAGGRAVGRACERQALP